MVVNNSNIATYVAGFSGGRAVILRPSLLSHRRLISSIVERHSVNVSCLGSIDQVAGHKVQQNTV